MTSEELRARLLRNAQRTDAAKAGAKWQSAYRSDASAAAVGSASSGGSLSQSAWQRPGAGSGSGTPRANPALLAAAAEANAQPDSSTDSPAASTDRQFTTRRLLRHYGNYASAVAKRAVEAVSAQDADQSEAMTTVTFWLQYHVDWGQRLRVIGSHPRLGSWDPKQAPDLRWNEGDRWSCTVQLPAGRIVEYKYVVLAADGNHATAWQGGNNSVLAVQAGERTVEVFDNWTGQPGAAVVADGTQSTREGRLLAWADGLSSQVESQRHQLRRSRMELVAAQEEARQAREDARQARMELAASEAERARLLAAARTADVAQRALRVQLAEVGAAFRAAFSTAQNILAKAELGEQHKDEDLAAAAKEAVELILPRRNASLSSSSLDDNNAANMNGSVPTSGPSPSGGNGSAPPAPEGPDGPSLVGKTGGGSDSRPLA